MKRRFAVSFAPGVTLSELIIMVGLIGILAALGVSKVFLTEQNAELQAARDASMAEEYNVRQLAEGTLGDLPLNYGPAKIFRRFSHMNELQGVGANVGACTSDGQQTFRLPNGVVLTSVGEAWGSSSDKPNMRNLRTGQPLPANRPGDWVCIALRGSDSKTLQQDAYWYFMDKNGPPILGNLPPRVFTEVGLFTACDSIWNSINNEVISYDRWQDSNGVWHYGYLSDQIMALRRFFGESEARLALAQSRIDYINTNLSKNYWGAKWYLDRDVSIGGVRSNVAGLTSGLGVSATQIRLMNPNGTALPEVKASVFGQNLEIGGVPWSTIKQQIIDQNGGQSWYDSAISWWTTAMAPGGSRSAGYWQAPSAEHVEWDLLSGYINSLYAQTGSDLSKIKAMEIVYTDTQSDKNYRINASFFSPLKVNLNLADAALDTDHGFLLDVDGFTANQSEPILTTGGLAQGEAWLATDRARNGFFNTDGILDGADVFGDHQGQFKNGYQDLATLYSAYLRTDDSGRRYLALNQLSESDKQALEAQRKAGHLTGFIPSLDLKLVLADGSVRDASEIFDRIYVDSDSVSEQTRDNTNKITDRAWVRYRNGHLATSADQWFQTQALAKDVLTPSPKLALHH